MALEQFYMSDTECLPLLYAQGFYLFVSLEEFLNSIFLYE